MGRSAQSVFHFHHDGGIADIDAVSYSEARRKFRELWGYFPPEDDRNESEPVR